MTPQLPFPGSLGVPPMTERQRAANSEHYRAAALNEERQQMRTKPRGTAAKPPTAADLRDTLLKRLAPLQGGIMYDPEAMQLVQDFEAALREAWEHGERGLVRQRAEEAVRNALEAIADGKLL